MKLGILRLSSVKELKLLRFNTLISKPTQEGSEAIKFIFKVSF